MSRILPILFNADMVRAILDGRKTVTRRVVKRERIEDVLNSPIRKNNQDIEDSKFIRCLIHSPYEPGDILYIRETWGYYGKHWFEADYFMYRADYQQGAKTYEFDGYICDLPKWHPSIHMPKEAARIWLKVTDVRVERLQDITEEQALKEGASNEPLLEGGEKFPALYDFVNIWNSTIKKPDREHYGWEANPYVWLIKFERCEKPKEISVC